MRLVRTDEWDKATRGEWEDIKRWSRVLAGVVAFAVAGVAARLVTSSYLAQLAIAGGVGVIVGVVSSRLDKRRSRISSAETHSDESN